MGFDQKKKELLARAGFGPRLLASVQQAQQQGYMKPYIHLDTELPGIVSLFSFDPQVAKPMSELAEVLLRRPSTLTIGERELIASFVSKMNGCEFCYGSHAACTRHFMDPETVDAFLEDEDSEAVDMHMRTLLVVAYHVKSLNRESLAEAINFAKLAGATDQEIHDTVAIAAAFCMFNRYVDGLGTTFEPEDLETSGASIAKYGYKMNWGRLIHEIIPQMWKRIFGSKS